MPGPVAITAAQIIAACSVNTHADTVRAIISVESSGNPLAIGVNGPLRLRAARDPADAAQLARYAISMGYSVDMGLMQVNSRNLAKLGLTPETVFDPCNNIRAGTTILSDNYIRARPSSVPVRLQHRQHDARFPQRLRPPLLWRRTDRRGPVARRQRQPRRPPAADRHCGRSLSIRFVSFHTQGERQCPSCSRRPVRPCYRPPLRI